MLGIKVTVTLISLLLTTPCNIIILVDITLDDSSPLKLDDVNSITATIEQQHDVVNHVSIRTVPSLSMIVTMDDDVPSDNGIQLGNNLIVMLSASLPSCIVSSMIFILNGDDFDPAEIVTLNTDEMGT